ncbi:potassium-transporting ATPase subunit KdpC [Massilia niastensis]|uniref:potassium-transporting ATPase subunit KdpC n=1 Tax=Massilia niastensis TaxID=544911 RepID=UPI000374EF35|nr:potassium-transporting ATPase subunit KdpC [Massilia niastensis]
MQSLIRPALVLFGALTLICGIVYPLAVTGIAQAAFPEQANGSLVRHGGQVVGSSLIGQSFSSPRYFWGRPSATGPMPANGAGSSGSNQGPANPALGEAVKARIAALRELDPGSTAAVPVDLVTASASGLDPEISIAAARYQMGRVARVRGLDAARVAALVDEHSKGRLLGVFGEPRVNVLALNLALDAESLHTR